VSLSEKLKSIFCFLLLQKIDKVLGSMQAAHSEPEPGTSEKAVRPTWADIPALISGIAIFAFMISSLYVSSISTKFQFSVWDYLDLVDYVQFLPLYWSVYMVAIFLVILFLAWWHWIMVARDTLTTVPRATEKRARFATLFSIVRKLNATFVLIGTFCLLWNILTQSGESLARELRTMGMSEVFRKGQSPSLEGKILLNGHRYILLLNKEGDQLTAIPQEEVQMIHTQRSAPSSASSAAPKKPTVPSPTTSASP
jgi:hypothetical protein